MSSSKRRLLVLASGRGSNFQAICQAVKKGEIPNAEVVGLITNRKDAGAIAIAQSFQIPATVIESKGKKTADYEALLLQAADAFVPDYLCLAGYMKILSGGFISRFAGRILNIHPSLLPQFPGLHAQKQALDAGVSETGCTVHWVTEGVDEGPVVEQARIQVLPGDTVESLSARLQPLEHATYVRALGKILTATKA